MKKPLLRRKRISSPAKLIAILRKDLDSELRIVRFYEDNLHLFRSEESREKIKELVLASLENAAKLAEAMHSLQRAVRTRIKIPSKITKKGVLFTLGTAAREEVAMKSLYRKQARRIKNEQIAGILIKLAQEKEKHQSVLREMAADIAEDLAEGKRKKILKKFSLI